MKTHAIPTDSTTFELRSLTNLLRFTYGLVPIVAGADKFTHILTDWNKYLSPGIAGLVPFSPDTFMSIVGVIEIIAGIIVLVRADIGAFVVSAWLVCIAATLLLSGIYLDVAVRDIVMAIGAFTLGRLARLDAHHPIM